MRTVRVLTHVKKLDDALGDFIVRVTCPCGASCKPHTCPCCSRRAMPGLLLRRSFRLLTPKSWNAIAKWGGRDRLTETPVVALLFPGAKR
jgi:hypothetical protein